MSEKTRKLCITAVGIALFVVLSLCLQVPVFENYYLCLGYAAMAVYCYAFGAISGTAVGFFGVILYCLLISGLRGMPGWALGNVVIGLSLGFWFKLARRIESGLVRSLLSAVVITAACAVGILGVKSITESLLYLQPVILRMGKNIYAFVADTVVLIASLPLCFLLDRYVKKLLRQK